MKPVSLALSLLALAALACSLGAPAAPAAPTLPEAAVQSPTQAPAQPAAPATEAAATPSEQSSPAPSAGQCQNLYYPVVQGATWQYQLSGTSSGTFTRSIINVRADGFDDQDVFSAGTTRNGSWKCENGNLISLTPGSGAAVTAAGVTATYTIESNSGISFPANLQPEQSWSQNIVYLGQENTNGVSIETRNVMDMSCKAGSAVEKVSVPSGDFEALRVDCSIKIDIFVSGALAFTFTSTSASWYAPGVGMVKSSGSSNMGNTEIVLLSHNIP
ncbi:MAG: hypothetical protein Fur0016_04920 [Anaerolineales bacterium]